MKYLLDKKTLKKVEVIETIFDSKNHMCAQKKLLEKNQITYPTLLAMVDIINDDVRRFGYSEVEIIHISTNKIFVLNINEDASIQLLLHAYIRESPKFELLKLLLTSSYPNLQLISDKLNISYSELRRGIKELNDSLKTNGVQISTNKGVALVGDELGIRLYYTFLFLLVYGGESWPFTFIQYFEITKLLQNCPNEIYRSGSIDKSVLIHFYVAIHLLRDRKNELVPTSRKFDISLYHSYSEETEICISKFILNIKSYVPNMNDEHLRFTSKLLISVLLAFGSYASIEKVPSFFYCETEFEKNGFLQIAYFIYEQVNQHLYIPFSNSEKEKFLYTIMSINYRFFLFKGLNINLDSVIVSYGDIKRNTRKQHKVDHLRPLIQQMMDLPELIDLAPFKEVLSSEYLTVFDRCIDFSKHTRLIKVAIISIVSNKTATFDFMSYFSNYYNVCVVDELEPGIDLFISDFPMSHKVLTALKIDQPIVYVNTRWNEADFGKVNQMLATIATDNFINEIN
ncbi:hypothetical protein IGI39_002081 [Enterococcus sp. AZ135]|uniref:helix-turn-helix domain-containing protein n=1 Tax=unclassified Enterococcus TaxID=2608891 RepID=UPI003F27C571